MQVYHGLDFSAYFLLLTRASVAMIEEEGVYKTREKLTEVVSTVLASYRNACCYNNPKCNSHQLVMISATVLTRVLVVAAAVLRQSAEVLLACHVVHEHRGSD